MQINGGRRTGSPTAPVYASTAVLLLGGEAELIPGWPSNREDFSVLIEKVSDGADGAWYCAVDFLARDLVADKVRLGVELVVFEGTKIVARGSFVKVAD